MLTLQIRLRFKNFGDLGFRFWFGLRLLNYGLKVTVQFGFNERKWLIQVFGLCSGLIRRPVMYKKVNRRLITYR